MSASIIIEKITSGIEKGLFKNLIQPFPPHFHNSWLIGVLSAGQRWFCTTDFTGLLEPGQMIILAPGQVHACKQMSVQSSCWHYLKFERNYFKSSQISPAIIEDKFLIALFLNIFQESPVSITTINEFIRELIKSQNGMLPGMPVNRAGFLEAGMKTWENLSLTEMAVRNRLGKFNFLRRFKRKHDITPIRYRNCLKLEDAVRLLQNGVTPLDIAFRLGYFDLSHFTKAFRKNMGLSPGHYQKMINK